MYKTQNREAAQADLHSNLYHSLTPSEDIQNGQEYSAALDWALEQDDILNIAVSGPYGSGKSSVIRTFFNRKQRDDILTISLAAFNIEMMFGNSQESIDEDLLENGILKQLFYSVSANKIPESRYRKIQPERKMLTAFLGLMMEALVLGVCFYLSPDKIVEFALLFKSTNAILKSIATLLFLVALWYACTIAVRWLQKNGNIREIKIADKAVVGNAENDKGESVFNKNLDEIVYFFEKTQYRIVVIEDLDRFESTNIFVALRELNNILNNYEGITGKVVFIYAIKDDMFQKEGERTKFFDFIIPIVPYISSTNSGEILRQQMLFDDKRDESKLYDISGRFVSLVSPYISDMRDLICICNEFIVFKNTLKGNQELNLVDEHMLSLIIFKNLYPKEFALLEDESNDSILIKAFRDKKACIEDRNNMLRKKRKDEEETLHSIEKEVLTSVKDLKAALLASLTNYEGQIRTINNHYTYNEVMRDDFDLSLLLNQYLTIYYQSSNGNMMSTTISDIEMYVQEQGGDYFSRIDRLRYGLDQSKEESRQRIEGYEKRINALHTNTMQQMINELGTGFLSDAVKQNDLLVFLLRNGLIDENYADYINYFHPTSISKDEMNFILGVRNHRSNGGYNYSLKNLGQVFSRLQDYEFLQKEILNFDLVDYVLEHRENSSAYNYLMEQLSDHSEDSVQFIKAHFERGIHIDLMLCALCHVDDNFWKTINEDSGTSTDTLFKYLNCMLEYVPVEDIKAQDVMNRESNGILSEFIERHIDVLERIACIPEEKQIQVIESLGICFEKVETQKINEAIKKYIFDNSCYVPNAFMLQKIVEWKEPKLVEGLKNKNYTTLLKTGYEPLLNNVNSNFRDYVENVVLGVESNNEEDIDAVEAILEHLCPDDYELSISVLKKENIRWENIEECCAVLPNDDSNSKVYKQRIWSYLLDQNMVVCSWKNVEEYYNVFENDEVWTNYISNNIDSLVSDDNSSLLSDDFKDVVLFSDLTETSFRKYVRNVYMISFDGRLSKLGIMKTKVMIEESMLPFSKAYWNELLEVSPELRVLYAEMNKNDFLNSLEIIDLKASEIKQLLEADALDPAEKAEVLKKLQPAEVTLEIAEGIKSITHAVPKEYIIAAWKQLPEEKRYELLLNQIESFDNEELPKMFAQLAPDYYQLEKRTRHKFTFAYTDYNKKLLTILKDRGYITSMSEEWIEPNRRSKVEKRREHVITGYVKQA